MRVHGDHSPSKLLRCLSGELLGSKKAVVSSSLYELLSSGTGLGAMRKVKNTFKLLSAPLNLYTCLSLFEAYEVDSS